MKSSSSFPSAGSKSREEVRQRYVAACEASDPGAPPPDLDSFVAGWLEPELSELRSELQVLAQARTRDQAGATVDQPTVPHHRAATGATIDFVKPTTEDLAGIAAAVNVGSTRDHVQDFGSQTMDHGLADTNSNRAVVDASVQGRMIAGYEILDVLGRGAMGVVYKARQRGLNRLVALKMILSGGHAGPDELTRFKSEAEAVAHLQHPNIVQIYEVGEHEGRPFFSLEFVDGASLDKKVQGTPLAPREAARLSQQLAQAMDYAHKRGIIHRDLKPANVLLAADGTPKIGDFGLAKRLEEDSGQTRTGTVLGTPSYMAPEQAEGKIDQLGPLSDVYSLGAILYDLLTGRAPFRGTTMLETLEQVRTREPVPPLELQPSVPLDLQTICLKCLQKDPQRRYLSAAALADDLDRFLKGEPIQARPVSRLERVWRWCKRNPRIAGLSAAVVLLVIVWAATSSILAWNLKLQTEEAVKNEKEAIKQSGIAKKQTLVAERNEQSAKATAAGAINQMVSLGKMLYARLQSKQLEVKAGAELMGLRREVLATLRQSLKKVSASIDAAGGTPYGEVGTYQAMGDLLAKLGQGDEALRSYQQGYELMKKLAEAKPDSDVARGNLYLMLQRLGDVPFQHGDARTALKSYRRARDQHWDIFVNPRDHFYSEREIKRVVSNDDIPLGRAYLALGQSAAAKKVFQESLTYRQEWLAEQKFAPSITSGRSLLMEARLYLGSACSNLGDNKGAGDHFEEALKIGEALQLSDAAAKKSPLAAAEFREDLGVTQGAFGDALLRLGKEKEAEQNYRQALTNIERATALDDLSRPALLAQMHERLATVTRRQGKKADADKHYLEAFKLRKELYQMQENNPAFQAAFVLAGARSGKTIPADHFAAKFRPGMPNSPELLLQLARTWSVCAAAGTPQKADYLKRALDVLKSATKDDYQDVVVLQTDPELEVLRSTPEFAAVIAQVKGR